MKPWFSLILVCWALLFLLLGLTQQAGLNYPLQVAGSGPWLDRCREPAPGSSIAAVLRSMEFDHARAAPLESLVRDCAWTVSNMGPPGQEINGPPQSLGLWRVAGQSRQLKATIKSLFFTKLLARPTEVEEEGFATAFSYVDNYGKTPSGGQRPAYAGETRSLFGLEMDGPTQSQEGGGSFDDGAIIDVRITVTTGTVEHWDIKPGGPWYLLQSAPSDWVKLHTSLGPGDGLKKVAVDANGFTGAIQVICIGSNPCKPFEEEGAAYRTLPSGRVLLVSWDLETGGNDFSYQKYLLPMLSSFKLLK